jgi:hypothetical protein
MDAAFQVFRAFFGGSAGLLLMGLFLRILTSGELPNPDQPGLTGPQRAGVWHALEARRACPFLIRYGLAGTVICALGMLLIGILR